MICTRLVHRTTRAEDGIFGHLARRRPERAVRRDAVDLLWQSLAAEGGEFTMAGKFLRAVLNGYDPGKLSFDTADQKDG